MQEFLKYDVYIKDLETEREIDHAPKYFDGFLQAEAWGVSKLTRAGQSAVVKVIVASDNGLLWHAEIRCVIHTPKGIERFF